MKFIFKCDKCDVWYECNWECGVDRDVHECECYSCTPAPMCTDCRQLSDREIAAYVL